MNIKSYNEIRIINSRFKIPIIVGVGTFHLLILVKKSYDPAPYTNMVLFHYWPLVVNNVLKYYNHFFGDK